MSAYMKGLKTSTLVSFLRTHRGDLAHYTGGGSVDVCFDKYVTRDDLITDCWQAITEIEQELCRRGETVPAPLHALPQRSRPLAQIGGYTRPSLVAVVSSTWAELVATLKSA